MLRRVLLVAAMAAVLAPATPAAARHRHRHPHRADLAVTSVGAVPLSVARGSTFTLRTKTKNRGKARAGASRTSFLLSHDRKRNHGDVALGTRKVKRLRPRRTSSGTAKLRVPKRAKAGSWRVLACADGRKKVKESSERNNCRVAKDTVLVQSVGGARAITRTLDTARAVTRTIGTAGGTVAATTAGGTTFTVSVPAGALLSDQAITVTPVQSVVGSGLSKLAGAVDLGPNGLRLAKPVTVTVTGAHLPKRSRQIGIGWHDAGADFHLEPLGPGSAVTLSVSHFSGLGLADASAKEVAALASHLPADAEARAAQELAAAVYAARACTGSCTAELKRVGAAEVASLRTWYEGRIKGLMKQAETDDEIFAAASLEGFSWAHEVAIFGLEDEFESELAANTASFVKGLKNAYAKSRTKCLNHDVRQVIRMLQLARMAAVLGIDVGDVMEDVRVCAHFHLDMDSEMTRYYDGSVLGDDVEMKVQDLDLTINPATLELTGTHDLAYVKEVFGTSCQAYTGATTSLEAPFAVRSLQMNLNFVDGRPVATDLKMLVFPGLATEVPHFEKCGDGVRRHTLDEGFMARHLAERTVAKPLGTNTELFTQDPSQLYAITGWTLGSGGVFATKSYAGTTKSPFPSACTCETWTERTTFTLRHTPG